MTGDRLTPSLTIAVDFDGVTAELPELPDTDAARAALDDAPTETLHELMVATPDCFDVSEFAREHGEAVRQTLLAADPVPGACDAINRLRDAGHEVVVVTNRPAALEPFTRRWLEANGIVHDGVRHVGDGCTKGELSDIDVVIDDSPHNALSAAAHGRLGILFAREWTDVTTVRNTESTVVADDWAEATRNIPGAVAHTDEIITAETTPAPTVTD